MTDQTEERTLTLAEFLKEENEMELTAQVLGPSYAENCSYKLKKSFDKLFENVTFAISGFKNPLRGELRNKGVAMGAAYKSDWDISCTHLISACVGTPRFNQAKGKSKIVKRYWIEDSYKNRIAYPWRRYALDISDTNQPESDSEIHEKEEDNNKKKRAYKQLYPLSKNDEEPEVKKPKLFVPIAINNK